MGATENKMNEKMQRLQLRLKELNKEINKLRFTKRTEDSRMKMMALIIERNLVARNLTNEILWFTRNCITLAKRVTITHRRTVYRYIVAWKGY